MKAIWNIAAEIFTALSTAAIDVVSVANVGGAQENYTYGGGNNQ